MKYKGKKQRQLLDKWLPHLRQIEEIDVVWLEGSMSDENRENPGSDIDIRFAIKDEAFEELWDSNRRRIIEPLGEFLPLESFRIMTSTGVLVEFGAYKTSDVIGMKVHEWKFLLNRLPEGQPGFYHDPDWAIAANAWPHPVKNTRGKLHGIAADLIRRMSTASSPFYNEQSHSALFELDLLRTRAYNFLYMQAGVKPFMRAKHLNEVFTQQQFGDYEYMQFKKDEYSLDFGAIAKATLRTFEVHIHCIKEMFRAAEISQEFPQEWVGMIFGNLKAELLHFIK